MIGRWRWLLVAGLIGRAVAGDAVVDYPAWLPPDAMVRQALEQAPLLVAAAEDVHMGRAIQRRRAVGNYEWEVSLQSQRRKDAMGLAYTEQEYGLLRRMRLPGKGVLDRAIGAQSAANGAYSYADAWHEASRVLLSGWFGWLRAERAAQLQREQLELLRQQQQIVAKRVTAGDAPRIEQLLAATEVERAAAGEIATSAAAMTQRLNLLMEFPALELRAPDAQAEPVALGEDDETWIARVTDSNHEIELADGQAEVARLEARRAGRDRVADPTFGVLYSNNLDGNRNVVGMSVAMPLGGALRKAELSLARSRATVAAAEAQRTRLNVTNDARLDVLNRRTHYLSWQRLTAVANQSRQNADTVARGYALGEFAIAELLNARRLAIESALAAETARLDALESDARLQLDAHRVWALDDHGPDSLHPAGH
jgi:outer membrane protein TolC